MPKFDVTFSDGQTYELEAEHAPTPQEARDTIVSYHERLQQQEENLPEPEGPIASFVRPLVTKAPAAAMSLLGRVIGGAGAGAVASETGPGAIAAAYAGQAAGAAAGGYLGQRLFEGMVGKPNADFNELQMAANRKASGVASGIGEALPTLLTMAGGVGSMAAGGAGRKVADASAGLASKIINPQTESKVAQYFSRSLASVPENIILGTAMTAGDAGAEFRKGHATIGDVMSEAFKGGVTMAPLSFIPAAKTWFGAMTGKALSDSAALTISNAVYDKTVRGKDEALDDIVKHGVEGLPGFMVLNGITHMLHGRAPKPGLGQPATDQPTEEKARQWTEHGQGLLDLDDAIQNHHKSQAAGATAADTSAAKQAEAVANATDAPAMAAEVAKGAPEAVKKARDSATDDAADQQQKEADAAKAEREGVGRDIPTIPGFDGPTATEGAPPVEPPPTAGGSTPPAGSIPMPRPKYSGADVQSISHKDLVHERMWEGLQSGGKETPRTDVIDAELMRRYKLAGFDDAKIEAEIDRVREGLIKEWSPTSVDGGLSPPAGSNTKSAEALISEQSAPPVEPPPTRLQPFTEADPQSWEITGSSYDPSGKFTGDAGDKSMVKTVPVEKGSRIAVAEMFNKNRNGAKRTALGIDKPNDIKDPASRENGKFGFEVTNTENGEKRYISREDAGKLARANGQHANPGNEGSLHSADVRPKPAQSTEAAPEKTLDDMLGKYVTRDGIHGELIKDGDTYVMRSPDGTTYEVSPSNQVPEGLREDVNFNRAVKELPGVAKAFNQPPQGPLVRLKDGSWKYNGREGYKPTFSHDADGTLKEARMEHADGGVVTLTGEQALDVAIAERNTSPDAAAFHQSIIKLANAAQSEMGSQTEPIPGQKRFGEYPMNSQQAYAGLADVMQTVIAVDMIHSGAITSGEAGGLVMPSRIQDAINSVNTVIERISKSRASNKETLTEPLTHAKAILELEFEQVTEKSPNKSKAGAGPTAGEKTTPDSAAGAGDASVAPETAAAVEAVQPPAAETPRQTPEQFVRETLQRDKMKWNDDQVSAAVRHINGDTTALDGVKYPNSIEDMKSVYDKMSSGMTLEQAKAETKEENRRKGNEENAADRTRKLKLAGTSTSEDALYQPGTEQIEQGVVPFTQESRKAKEPLAEEDPAGVSNAASQHLEDWAFDVISDPDAKWDARIETTNGVPHIELNSAYLKPGDVLSRIAEEVGHHYDSTPEGRKEIEALMALMPPEVIEGIRSDVERDYSDKSEADKAAEVRAKALRDFHSGDSVPEARAVWQRIMDAVSKLWKQLTGKDAQSPQELADGILVRAIRKYHEAGREPQSTEGRQGSDKHPFIYRLHSMFSKSPAGKELFDGVGISQDGTIPRGLWNSRTSQIPKYEKGVYELLVPEAFQGDKVNVKLLDNTLRDLPAAEVHVYGMDGKDNPERRELDGLIHKFDTLGKDPRDSSLDWTPEQRVDRERMTSLQKIVAAQPDDSGPKATQAYGEDISPWLIGELKAAGGEFLRIDVLLKPRPGKKSLWIGDRKTHEPAGDETLGWAGVWFVPVKFLRGRGAKDYIKGGKFEHLSDEEKVTFVGEQQSEWGQEIQKKQAFLTGMMPDKALAYKAQLKADSHPLLPFQHALVLKAVIAEAQKRGVTRVVISDGESAMMTEGHDKTYSEPDLIPGEYSLDVERLRQRVGDATGKVVIYDANTFGIERANGSFWEMDRQGNSYPLIEDILPKVEGEARVSQSGGMRLHYDTTLTAAMAKITGDKGQAVDMGVHKNAAEQQNYSNIPVEQRSGMRPVMLLKGSPAFRNADGTPKTSVTGIEFSIPHEAGNDIRYSRSKQLTGKDAQSTEGNYIQSLKGDSGTDALPEKTDAKTVSEWLGRNPRSAAELQRQVDERAKAAGYKIEAFRGDRDAGFNKFDLSSVFGPQDATSGPGFYFTSHEEEAKNYGKVRKFYLKSDNPLYIGKSGPIENSLSRGTIEKLNEASIGTREEMLAQLLSRSTLELWSDGYMVKNKNRTDISFITKDQAKEIGLKDGKMSDDDVNKVSDALISGKLKPFSGVAKSTIEGLESGEIRTKYQKAMQEYLKSSGRTGVTAITKPRSSGVPEKTGETTHHVVFDPSQIKSADPITLDNEGRIIPLNERFKSEGGTKSDIRYSRIETVRDEFKEAGVHMKASIAKAGEAIGPINKVPGKIMEVIKETIKTARTKLQTLHDTDMLAPALKMSGSAQKTAGLQGKLELESSELFKNDVQRLAAYYYVDAYTKAKRENTTAKEELDKGIEIVRQGKSANLHEDEAAHIYARDLMTGKQKDFIVQRLGDVAKEYGSMAQERGYFKGKSKEATDGTGITTDEVTGGIDIEKEEELSGLNIKNSANGWLPRHIANKDSNIKGSFMGRKHETIFELRASGNTLETKDPGKGMSRYIGRIERLIAKPRMAAMALMTGSNKGTENAMIVRSHKIGRGSLSAEPEAVVFEDRITGDRDKYLDDNGKTWAKGKDSIITGVPVKVAMGDGTYEYRMADIALNHRLDATYKREGARSGIKDWYEKPSSSAMEAMGKIAVKYADKAINVPAKVFSLAFSLFHATTVGAQASLHGFNIFRLNGEKLDAESPRIKDYGNYGAQLFEESGEMAYRDGVGLNKAFGGDSALGKMLNWPGKFTFEYLIPRLKVRLYEAQEERNMGWFGWKAAGVDENGIKRWTPSLSPEEAAKLKPSDKMYDIYAKGVPKSSTSDVKHYLWTTVNDEMGHRNYRIMGTNRTAQHISSMLMFAPDFNLGRVSTMLNAARGLSGGPAGREQARVLALSAVGGYVAARVLNAMLNDGDTKEDHPFSLVYNGTEYSIRTMPSDVWKMWSNPSQWAASRLSPVVNFAKEEVLQRNWKGEKITHYEGLKNLGIGFIPMSARGIPGIRDIAEPGKGGKPSVIDQALNFLGIHSMEAGPIKEVKSAARRWESANGIESKGAYAESRYKAMKNALDMGDSAMTRSAFDKLVEDQVKLDPKRSLTDVRGRIIAGLKDSLDRHFTDSIEHDKAFIGSLDVNHRRMYEEAISQLSRMWDMAKSVTGTGSGKLKITEKH